MKISKKTLILLMTVGMLSLVGCSSTNSNNDDLSQDNTVETMNEETLESDSLDITEEDALKMVEEYVHKVEPNAKLKVSGMDENRLNPTYIVKYDVPFLTQVKFFVDAVNKDITLGYSTGKEVPIAEFEKDVEYDKSQGEPLSLDEIISSFEKVFAEIGEHSGLTQDEINSLELACDYMVKTNLNYTWVLRYPMSEEHKEIKVIEGTYDNALNVSDKYGYLYVDPYEKTYCTYLPTTEWWEDLQ